MKVASGFALEATSHGLVLRGASLEEQVKESLRAALLTRRGERVLWPELGSELYRYVFRPLSESLLDEMKKEVRETIARSEPRVRVVNVEVQRNEGEPERIGLKVSFEYKNTQKNGQVRVDLQG